MTSPVFSNRSYQIFFTLLALSALPGLFVPLMDNDAAHHANIALHMYQHGDYVNLIDQGQDYLDKPHLHFWLSALSFHLFGVNGFAYKLPSFLFAVAGVYAVFRIGSKLYDKETGKLAALIFGSSFAFLLSVSDVRMDAILVSCIALSSWLLLAFLEKQTIKLALLSGFSLALGFCTKGYIGIFIPLVFILAHILVNHRKRLFDPKWLLVLLFFLLFISPVVYCYYLQFNLHPEKMVRGQDHINGVKFILLDQPIDRFTGKMEKETNHDHLFFLKSFPVSFLPWSLLFFALLIHAASKKLITRSECSSLIVFGVALLLVSFSGYQLPHYLDIIFPFTSVLLTGILLKLTNSINRSVLVLQGIVISILLLVAAVLNTWSFPITQAWKIITIIFLLAFVFYQWKSKTRNDLQRAIGISVAGMAFIFFLLNSNFYLSLLKYQGGNNLATKIPSSLNDTNIYFWPNNYSSSFNFYTRTIRKQLPDSSVTGTNYWLVYDQKDEAAVRQQFKILPGSISVADYEVTRLSLPFLDPEKRESQCTRMILSQVIKN